MRNFIHDHIHTPNKYNNYVFALVYNGSYMSTLAILKALVVVCNISYIFSHQTIIDLHNGLQH